MMRRAECGTTVRFVVAVAACWALAAGDAAAQGPSEGRARVGLYTGAGSCNGVACHGSLRPKDTGTLLNESTTWLVSLDRHSRAYSVLSEDRSIRMWASLHPELADDPVQSDPARATLAEEECRSCHALPADASRWAVRIPDPQDGVSCESCHGPAGGWLGDHYKKGWKEAGRGRAVARGDFWDMASLVTRARVCASCHVGDAEVPGRFVSHELMAAGHPRLDYELASFDRVIDHWRDTPARRRRVAREWGLGQAVALRKQVSAALAHAGGRSLLEFSDLDCFSCHHNLGAEARWWKQKNWKPTWQQKRSLGRPGMPVLNPAFRITLRHLAARIAPETWTALEGDLKALSMELGAVSRQQDRIEAAGGKAIASIDTLAGAIEKAGALEDEAMLLALAGDIASGHMVDWYGFIAAEQVAYALNALSRPLTAGGKRPGLGDAINRLQKQIEDPARFDPAGYVSTLGAVRAALK